MESGRSKVGWGHHIVEASIHGVSVPRVVVADVESVVGLSQHSQA